MSLTDYLAKNYLTADPPADKKSKKRKRKAAKNDAGGLIIADDDISGWNTNTAENDDDDAPTIGTQFLNYTPNLFFNTLSVIATTHHVLTHLPP